MSQLDKTIKSIINTILTDGVLSENRTNTPAYSYPGIMIRHDMSTGFPLITLRKIPCKSAFIELEGFLHGITDKTWYQKRGCHFWDSWCSPSALKDYNVKHNTDYIYGSPEAFNVMKEISYLGPIYGFQWVNGQLSNIINTLKTNPSSRRMLCTAWNVNDLDDMALPPCHFAWQVTVTNNKLNLFFHQRSCDFILGNNIVGYGMLLKLLAMESGYKEGFLIATYNDCHIYENHKDGAIQLISRDDNIDLPIIEIPNFTSINQWKHSDVIITNYNPIEPNIKFPVAI